MKDKWRNMQKKEAKTLARAAAAGAAAEALTEIAAPLPGLNLEHQVAS